MVFRQCLCKAPVWTNAFRSGTGEGQPSPGRQCLAWWQQFIDTGKLWLIWSFDWLSYSVMVPPCQLKLSVQYVGWRIEARKTWSPLQPLMQSYTKQLFHLGSISMSYLSNVTFNQCDAAFSDFTNFSCLYHEHLTNSSIAIFSESRLSVEIKHVSRNPRSALKC